MTSPNSKECYFKVDSVIEGDLSASNITTFDTTAKSISSTTTFSVDGNASVATATNVTELTSAAKYNLNATGTTNQISIDLHNHRLSNARRPQNDCEPVPAYYVRSPEFYYTTIPADARTTFNAQEATPLELISYQTITYQSRNANQMCRIVNYDKDTQKATFPGKRYIQLLAKGTYILSFGITKRWGWNNGWGGAVYLKNPVGGDFSNTITHGGGGYPEQGCLGTVIQVTNPAPDPNAPLGEYAKHILYLTQDDQFAVLSAFYFSILFYPSEEFTV